ncbi:MAG: methyltransferase domain-containing protein [Planctomycetota bacterium]
MQTPNHEPSTKLLAQQLLARLNQGNVLENVLPGLDVLGRLSERLGAFLADAPKYRFSMRRYRNLLDSYYTSLPIKPCLRNSTVVEVGCGVTNPWGLSTLFLALGAKKCHAFDLFPVEDAPRAACAIAELIRHLLSDPAQVLGSSAWAPWDLAKNLSGFDVAKLNRGDPSGVDRKRLRYAVAPGKSLPLKDGKADVVVSTAVLEHVEDVEEVVAELARVTRSGGFNVHGIDATDHRRYHDKTIDQLDYLTIVTDEPHFFVGLPNQPSVGAWMNRKRPAEYRAILAKHGFDILDVQVWSRANVTRERRAQFVEPYRSMAIEELEVTGARVLLRKR